MPAAISFAGGNNAKPFSTGPTTAERCEALEQLGCQAAGILAENRSRSRSRAGRRESGGAVPLVGIVFIFLTAIVVAYSGALVPGPMFTLVVAESAERGAKAGPVVTLGHGVLELVLLGGLAAGLTRVITLPSVIAWISLVGGVVMIWMGATLVLRSLRSRGSDAMELGAGEWGAGRDAEMGDRPAAVARNAEGRRGILRLMGLGVIVSLSNPYWSLWWATVGSAYLVSAAVSGFLGIAAFFLGHILGDMTWYALLSFGVARGRRLLTPIMYRGLIGACGVALVGLAAYFMIKGARGV